MEEWMLLQQLLAARRVDWCETHGSRWMASGRCERAALNQLADGGQCVCSQVLIVDPSTNSDPVSSGLADGPKCGTCNDTGENQNPHLRHVVPCPDCEGSR